MELEKRYVPVTVHFDAGGKMRPIEIEFDETRRYHIDKILDVRRAACQSVGGVGDRYTLSDTGQEVISGLKKADGLWPQRTVNKEKYQSGILQKRQQEIHNASPLLPI